MIDDIRIEVATLRTIVADLSKVVAENLEEVRELRSLIALDGYIKARDRELRNERATAHKYRLIRDLADHLGPGCIEHSVRRIMAIFDGRRPCPDGATAVVNELRKHYAAGPGKSTIRRALSKFPN